MKKIAILIAFFVGMLGYAQDSKHEKIKAMKTAHITSELDLTASEAEKFWPIYHEYDKNNWKLRKSMKEAYHNMKDSAENLSDAEANTFIEESLKYQRQELELRQKLIKDLRGVIPAQKIIKLRKAEEDFKRMLLKRYRERKGKKKK
ncbi:sensor of ECF-type sigma factor [Luteirhabdus pelagi]|uniref:sensor of ECF-type sigma factor n=1 Tax=Luteirhabdus pelagi TaxID=2792783 RepID=UPI0019399695|nr:sensor of ECF-type sigma factor [Luteirhabdus pelagi]